MRIEFENVRVANKQKNNLTGRPNLWGKERKKRVRMCAERPGLYKLSNCHRGDF